MRLLQAQYGHALQMPRGANQRPLASGLPQATHRELSKAHHGFDDAEDGFDGLLAQGIGCATRLRCQTMRHGLHWRGIVG